MQPLDPYQNYRWNEYGSNCRTNRPINLLNKMNRIDFELQCIGCDCSVHTAHSWRDCGGVTPYTYAHRNTYIVLETIRKNCEHPIVPFTIVRLHHTKQWKHFWFYKIHDNFRFLLFVLSTTCFNRIFFVSIFIRSHHINCTVAHGRKNKN